MVIYTVIIVLKSRTEKLYCHITFILYIYTTHEITTRMKIWHSDISLKVQIIMQTAINSISNNAWNYIYNVWGITVMWAWHNNAITDCQAAPSEPKR